MKYLHIFESFKELYGKTVYVISNDKFTEDENRVVYEREDGTKDVYIGDKKDISDDFKDTDDTFKLKDISKPKPKKKKNKKYNLIYRIGNSYEVLERDLIYPVAMKLKKDYLKSDNFKKGKIEIKVI